MKAEVQVVEHSILSEGFQKLHKKRHLMDLRIHLRIKKRATLALGTHTHSKSKINVRMSYR